MSAENSQEDLSQTIVEAIQPGEVTKMKLYALKDELKRRKLKTSGKKDELVERLKAALVLETAKEDEDDNDEADEDDEDESELCAEGQRRKPQDVFSIRDVEESMQTFSGDDSSNVHDWLSEFEEMAILCKWSDIQKVIYCKRLLRGSAKIFVRFERCSASWKQLKSSLQEEFATDEDVYNITKELRRRRKQPNETNNEYIYKMCEIAGRMNKSSIIKYIIEGIDDKPVNKAILYGATTIQELKQKFAQYESMKEEMQDKTKLQGEVQKKKQPARATEVKTKRCFNCGSQAHHSAVCPAKSLGTKCFKCDQFGHIASKCTRGASKEVCSITQTIKKKPCKEVEIMDTKMVALVDTGSDLNLIRADRYVKIGAPKLGKTVRFNGIGSKQNNTLGEFETTIVVDECVYPIALHVVSDTLMRYDVLIGTDFLNGVEMRIRDGNISILKPEEQKQIDCNLPEIFKIDVVQKRNEIDLTHVKSPVCQQLIKDAIGNYEPNKTREVGIQMNLILTDEQPVYQRPRRLSPRDKVEVDEQIKEWLDKDIIRPSCSDYASPVVLVRKKDGTGRLCVDYRQLNKKILKERYPLPLIEDQIDALQGAKIFSTLDLKNGFFHVNVSEASRRYTAFVVPNGHYEFCKMPFGLCNSPSVFQKFINAVFKDLVAKKVVSIYVDDLIIPADNVEDAIRNIRLVLAIASQYGLQINWKKCRFLEMKIEYLGYIIENGKIQPSDCKITAVMKFPRPTNSRVVHSFLGLTGYFRKFIPRYSVIARPLFNLLKKDVAFKFGPEEQTAFERLKFILSDKPVLRLYRTSAETELHTDACGVGYGAILMQRDNVDGAMHPIYYASGVTSPAEQKYCSYELEVLAIIKALRKFRVYLLGIPFKIITDCQAFTMTINKKDLCVRVARWALLLEEFAYAIEHRPGKSMSHVDALSRNPLPVVMLVDESEIGLLARLKNAQREDARVMAIINRVKEKKVNNFVLKNDLLYREVDDDVLVVVPRALQIQVIRQAHERGHFGVLKTEKLVKQNYWFEGAKAKIEKVIRNCINCILAERKQGKQEGFLYPIRKGELPMDTYHIDHLGPISSTKKSYRYIFAVIDSFTKFTWLYATRSTDAAEVINHLKKQAIVFGNPRRIVSDRGTAFTSNAFAEYCKDENIQHVTTTTGIPRANGQIERVNRTLISLLTKMSAPRPEEWYKYLPLAQKYLNATPSRSIGTTPFHLLFGTHIRVKEDPSVRKLIEDEWINIFCEDRDAIRGNAKAQISKLQEENRKNFNKRRKEARQYNLGDFVAIKRTQFAPGSKFLIKFLGPYRIQKVLRNNRYVVEKVGEHEGPSVTSTAADYMKPWSHAIEEFSSDDDTDI